MTNIEDNYESFVTNIKDKFITQDQQEFVNIFLGYINYKEDEFVIDVDKIYSLFGYKNKGGFKKPLDKNFKRDIDYKEEIYKNTETSLRGGQNHTTILLTINCFKEFCKIAKADQEKSDKMLKYYKILEKMRDDIVEKLPKVVQTELIDKDIQKEDNDKQKLIEDEIKEENNDKKTKRKLKKEQVVQMHIDEETKEITIIGIFANATFATLNVLEKLDVKFPTEKQIATMRKSIVTTLNDRKHKRVTQGYNWYYISYVQNHDKYNVILGAYLEGIPEVVVMKHRTPVYKFDINKILVTTYTTITNAYKAEKMQYETLTQYIHNKTLVNNHYFSFNKVF